jgi:Fe-S oxidoreductase
VAEIKNEFDLDVRDINNFRYDAERCMGCKGCAWVDHIYMPGVEFGMRCPSLVRYSFDAYAAYGRLKIALGLMDGKYDYTDRLLDIIYKCPLCGACDAGCKRNTDIEPLLVLESLRIKCVQDGKGPMPEHRKMADEIERAHNRYGNLHERRHDWIPADAPPVPKSDVIYFPGCAASYTHHEISQATARILAATNTPYMVVDDWCCGNKLYSTGQIDAARKQMEHNIEVIRESGASTVLVSCAGCYKTLKVDYPKILKKSTEELGFKVIHLSEYAEQKLKEGALKLTNKIETKATYHDACQLARLSEPWIQWEGKRGKWGVTEPVKPVRRGTYGVYEAPRELIRNVPGIEFVEMIRIRENAWCCGAGGGVREAFKDFALWSADERLEEARAVGAEAMVVCCPDCKENFNESIEAKKGKIKVYDISELLFEAIKG